MARPRSEEARQRVLSTAQDLIAEVGVGGFTVDAVAKQSGVAKTTIYRHWPTGNDLLLESISCAIEPFPTPNTGSLRDDLIILYTGITKMHDDPAMFRMMLGVMARSAADESFNKLKNELVRERQQPVITVLELARGRGEIPADMDLHFAVDILEGPFASRKMMRGEPITAGEIPKYVDAALNGILARD